MAEPYADSQLLPLNFPQDFLPERRLLGQLLPFAAANGSGDKVRIGAETGIPTGESTGKVEPMIHYSRGMGLIRVEKTAGLWQLGLTPLGRVVAREDRYLSEPVTLWVLHLMLCRRNGLGVPAAGVADAWFALFAEGSFRLGSRFEHTAYLDYLAERHGAKGYLKGLSGLVLRSYLETTCFGPIKALHTEVTTGQPTYIRRSAPADNAHFPAYSSYLFIIWDQLFPDQSQLAIDDLFIQTRCLAVLGWDRGTANRWLDWMADRGMIQLDRQTGGALVLRLQEAGRVISRIYEELS